jgi:hypothetical protein
MRRTRFMSWFFLVLSLSFFLVRDFRFALEAPLANLWWARLNTFPRIPSPRLAKLYTLERYVSTAKLRALAEKAAERGDSRFVAFAALTLPQREASADITRLADRAVEMCLGSA